MVRKWISEVSIGQRYRDAHSTAEGLYPFLCELCFKPVLSNHVDFLIFREFEDRGDVDGSCVR